jgi:hypothetical protein
MEKSEIIIKVNEAFIKALLLDGADEETAYLVRARLLEEFGIV